MSENAPYEVYLVDPGARASHVITLVQEVTHLSTPECAELVHDAPSRIASFTNRSAAEDLAAPQWVAHAGLDPRPYDSGTSIHRPRRISEVGNRHLRAALYMPALVAIQHEPNVKAFYNKLIAAGKKPMQAVVAVMRKLLHSIWGMLKHDQDFDGEKFFKVATKNT